MAINRDVGYGKPPKANRFTKGKSGNPKGRPKNRHKEPPYEAILGQMMPVTENGKVLDTSAEDAFLKSLMKLSSEGNTDAAIALSSALEEAEALVEQNKDFQSPPAITITPVPPGSVSHHLRKLKIVRLLYAKQPQAELKIENWIVSQALERLDGWQLSLEEQKTIMAATHQPGKIDWPEWWQVNESGNS